MLELFPLVNENHALGVDQSEPVNASQHYTLTIFSIGSFVNRGDVTKGLGFVHWRRGRRFKRAELCEIVNIGRKLTTRLGINLKGKKNV